MELNDVNGRHSEQFLLDTGATSNCILDSFLFKDYPAQNNSKL